MYKRILVAVDGSNTSHRAFQTALELAASMGAELQPLYVVDNAPAYFEAPGYDPSLLRGKMMEEGNALAADFGKEMAARGVKGALVVEEAASTEDISAAVLRATETFQADLLVMGTHARRGVERFFMGSVAERCLRQASLPVLLIPTAAGQEENSEEDKA